MGEVYKAFDPTLQRTIAVKTVRPDIDRPEYLERMMREAQACARLSHPNIVTVYEAGQFDGVVFIAMEYLQGENLADVLEKSAMTLDQKIHVLAKVLEALHHAHNLDVVHRDIKPSNIHVCGDGVIKLMDFGLARVLVADTLTASGNVLGTPHYASPEQLKGETVDRRTDIYSTGVMAYEMLSGRRPFEPDNDTISSVILKVIQQPPAPMDTPMSRLLPEIETIVARAMAKRPDERFQTADEMRCALLAFLEHSRARLSAIDSPSDATIIVTPPAAGQPAAAASSAAMVTQPVAAGTAQPFTPPVSQPSLTTQASSAATPDTAPAAATTALPPPSPNRAWMWAGGAAAAVVVGALLIAAPSRDMTAPPAESTSTAAAPAPPLATPPASNAANPGADDTKVAAAPAGNAVASTAASLTAAEKRTTPAPAPADSPAVTGTTAAVPAKEMTAKEMFSARTNIAPGLRFRLIQAGVNDAPMDVDPSKEFRTGDRIRFAFESNIDGYLYVAQQGTSGNWTVLFPNPQINGGRNKVQRFEEYEVPSGDWFQMAGEPGSEQIFVFLSREPLATLPGFEQPVKSFERGNGTMIASLQNSIQSRDLVFTKDPSSSKTQSTYIVNKAELGKAVTARFSLTHR